jgi:hypothetical protein
MTPSAIITALLLAAPHAQASDRSTVTVQESQVFSASVGTTGWDVRSFRSDGGVDVEGSLAVELATTVGLVSLEQDLPYLTSKLLALQEAGSELQHAAGGLEGAEASDTSALESYFEELAEELEQTAGQMATARSTRGTTTYTLDLLVMPAAPDASWLPEWLTAYPEDLAASHVLHPAGSDELMIVMASESEGALLGIIAAAVDVVWTGEEQSDGVGKAFTCEVSGQLIPVDSYEGGEPQAETADSASGCTGRTCR